MQVDISNKKYRFKDGYVIHFSQEDDYELIGYTSAWSEEDEYCRHQLIVFCENCMVQDSNAKKCANWLKSLRPQNRWKPSEEQIDALDKGRIYIPTTNIERKFIDSLLEDLKKLMG